MLPLAAWPDDRSLAQLGARSPARLPTRSRPSGRPPGRSSGRSPDCPLDCALAPPPARPEAQCCATGQLQRLTSCAHVRRAVLAVCSWSRSVRCVMATASSTVSAERTASAWCIATRACGSSRSRYCVRPRRAMTATRIVPLRGCPHPQSHPQSASYAPSSPHTTTKRCGSRDRRCAAHCASCGRDSPRSRLPTAAMPRNGIGLV